VSGREAQKSRRDAGATKSNSLRGADLLLDALAELLGVRDHDE
jgi:hypothetical protein